MSDYDTETKCLIIVIIIFDDDTMTGHKLQMCDSHLFHVCSSLTNQLNTCSHNPDTSNLLNMLPTLHTGIFHVNSQFVPTMSHIICRSYVGCTEKTSLNDNVAV